MEMYSNYAVRIDGDTTTTLRRSQVFESEHVPLEANAASMIFVDYEANEAASYAHDAPDDSYDDEVPSYEAYVFLFCGMPFFLYNNKY